MTYRVATGDSEGRARPWFAMFLAMTFDFEATTQPTLQELLDKHNAHADASEMVNIGDDLIFETEGDAFKFALMWTESETIFERT